MKINQLDLSVFGAKMLADYTISGTPISTEYQKKGWENSFTIIGSQVGLKTISFTLDIRGENARDCAIKKSNLDAELRGQVELFMPNDFYYTCVLKSSGDAQPITSEMITCSYSFEGIQHDAIVTQTVTRTITAQGTMPKMNCILSTTVGSAAPRYTLAGAVFLDVVTGDKLCLDGITKRVLINDSPMAQRCEFTDFPYLVPGENNIVCSDPVTVQYYPSYL